MIKKLATLTIDKMNDHKNTVVNALEEAGFVLVQEYDGITEDIFIVASEDKDE